MTEHPILFSAPMIRAILDGRKTMTRRIVKSRKDRDIGCHLAPNELAGEINSGNYRNSAWGRPGDALWVRETWAYAPKARDWEDCIPAVCLYRSDTAPVYTNDGVEVPQPTKWRPSIFMPRWASRITLRITDVGAERLQDISAAEALAEGVEIGDGDHISDARARKLAHARFPALWDSLNAKRGYGWNTNPLVWVISFERVEPKP